MTINIVRKTYFLVILIFTVLNHGLFYMYPETMLIEASDIISLIAAPFGLIALFGYAFSKFFYKQWFWKIISIIILSNEIIYGTYYFIIESKILTESSLIDLSQLKGPLIAILIFIPYYIGITKYAFNNNYWYREINENVT